MNHFETFWKTYDGLAIYAQGWEPDLIPPKAVICLVHGIGEHSGRYSHAGRAFSESGYKLFGFDLRGHGRSEGPKGHFPSAEAIIEDIDLLLDSARSRFPGRPLFLYGHSLGGILVLFYGLKRKTDIAGIIATGSGLKTALQKQPLKILAARLLGTLFPSLSIPSGLDNNAISQDKAVVEAYNKDPLVHDKMSLGFGKTILGVIQWTFDHAKEFSLPLLLMHGKSDSVAFPESSTGFAELVKENCQLVMWENGYHELHNEPFKEEVFKTMINWVNNILTNRSGT